MNSVDFCSLTSQNRDTKVVWIPCRQDVIYKYVKIQQGIESLNGWNAFVAIPM